MYDATLRHLDDTVVKILNYAREVSDDLITVIVGDHGELFRELGIIGHNLALHNGVINVPMIISGISDVVTDQMELTQQVDLSYIIANITGLRTNQFEGRDVRSGGRTYAIS